MRPLLDSKTRREREREREERGVKSVESKRGSPVQSSNLAKFGLTQRNESDNKKHPYTSIELETALGASRN
jgi:hypothetical protein